MTAVEHERPTGNHPSRARRLLRRGLLVGCVGWLAYTVLNAVLAGGWWAWLVPSSLPPLSFIVVPVLLGGGVVAARFRSRSAWICLAAALLVGLPQTDFSIESPADQATTGTRLSVVSWNTEYWDQDEDSGAFYAFMKRQNADVYLLQEYIYWDGHDKQPIDRRADLEREFAGRSLAIQGELVTVSRYPIVRVTQIAADVMRTDIDVDGTVVAFYNVHVPVQVDLERNPLGSGFWSTVHERDAERQTELRALRADVSGGDGALLIAGDFNSSSGTGDVNWFRWNLHDAAAQAATIAYPRSWPADRWLPLWRLDWCFVRGGPHAQSYDLRQPPRSDHKLQFVTIDVPRGRG